MSERNEKRGSASGWALGAGLLFAALSVLYVSGIGPATWVGEHYPETQDFICAVYMPLALLAECCRPIKTALEWYVGFWI
jgi:hypothetical protein